MTNNTNIHCAICQGDWDSDSGAVVGHPTALHICVTCFDADIIPMLQGHDAPNPRPCDGPCLVSWEDGYGIPIP